MHSYGDIGENAILDSYIEHSPHISFSEIGMGHCHTDGNGFELESSFVRHASETIAIFFERLTDGMRQLFTLSENDIITALEHHYAAEEKIEQGLAQVNLRSLGDNPSMDDLTKHKMSYF